MMLAIDLGAEDFEAEEEGFEIITEPGDFDKVRDGLAEAGYKFAMAELTHIPQTTVKLTDPDDIKTWKN